MNRARPLRSTLLLLVWGCCALHLAGCEMFRDSPAKVSKTESGLPQIRVPSDALELEILLVERPTGDRLLGDALWNEVDTILNMEPEEQRDLAKNGFRVGMSGSHPPAALQQLLEMRARPQAGEVTTSSDSDQRLQGNRIFLRSGSETQIQLNDVPYHELQFQLFPSQHARQPETRRYSDGVRCLYRVTVRKEQPGWARLEFVPEIHYGMDQLRPAAGVDQWELKSQPNIERLLAQRFSVVLNTGDMALVTGRGELPDSVGQRFFTGPAGNDSVQRMLIVRLARVANADITVASSKLAD